jgi:two-component system chemotaxis response regulator CheY
MRAKDYALVISDAHMAPMNGVELLAQLRADERTAKTPFLMVAGDADDGPVDGASDTIVKPFTAQSLKAKLVPVIGEF